MPLSEEMVNQLVGLKGDDVTSLMEKLKGKPIYQEIFNHGHRTATDQERGAREAAETREKETKTKLTALQTEFDQYKSKTPDVAAIEQGYQTKLTELQQKFDDYKEKAKQEKIDDLVARARIAAREKLKKEVDPVYAESLVDRDSIKERITSSDGKTLRILQPEQQIPFAGDFDAQVDALVNELKTGVSADYLRTDVPPGPGRETQQGGSGSGKGWDAIREKAKAAVPAGGPSSTEALNKAFGKT